MANNDNNSNNSKNMEQLLQLSAAEFADQFESKEAIAQWVLDHYSPPPPPPAPLLQQPVVVKEHPYLQLDRSLVHQAAEFDRQEAKASLQFLESFRGLTQVYRQAVANTPAAQSLRQLQLQSRQQGLLLTQEDGAFIREQLEEVRTSDSSTEQALRKLAYELRQDRDDPHKELLEWARRSDAYCGVPFEQVPLAVWEATMERVELAFEDLLAWYQFDSTFYNETVAIAVQCLKGSNKYPECTFQEYLGVLRPLTNLIIDVPRADICPEKPKEAIAASLLPIIASMSNLQRIISDNRLLTYHTINDWRQVFVSGDPQNPRRFEHMTELKIALSGRQPLAGSSLLQDIAAACPNLNRITIDMCAHIRGVVDNVHWLEESIRFFRASCPNIQLMTLMYRLSPSRIFDGELNTFLGRLVQDPGLNLHRATQDYDKLEVHFSDPATW